ncbi:hypothetical protein ACFQ1R_06565 [Mariniflexile jejuense]|uniref:WG repeat protein n=1 Tax=Mariniflexile jejuense TaxID=1173582 RepID=A0ABW3JIV1_9FLAO
MKKLSLILIALIIGAIAINCDSDPCDEGYTQIDNGVCVPDYVVGIEKSVELGNVFYHPKYGAITYKDGNWYNNENLILKNINN